MKKPRECDGCPLNKYTHGFVPPVIRTRELLVGEAPGETEAETGVPFSGPSGAWLNSLLKAAKRSRDQLSIINTICCRPPDNIYPGTPESGIPQAEAEAGIAYCWNHIINPAITGRWDRINTLGEHALKIVTGKSGVYNWRGSPLSTVWSKEVNVVPTYHPAYVMRQPSVASVVIHDLRKKPRLAPENYNLFPTPDEFASYNPRVFAFDLEWDPNGAITLVGFSSALYEAVVVPWSAPYIPHIQELFENAEMLIGHNIVTADLQVLPFRTEAQIMDTLLMQHLAQPDYPHSLAFCASIFTNKPFWKGKGDEEQFRTWTQLDASPIHLGGYGGCKSEEEAFRLYNARDVDASFQIYFPLRNLLEKYDLLKIYQHVSRPIGYICADMNSRPLIVDSESLQKARSRMQAELYRLESTLPPQLRSYRKEIWKHVPAKLPYTKLCRNNHKPFLIEFPYVPLTLPCPVCGKEYTIKKPPKTMPVPGEGPLVRPWASSQMLLSYAKEKGLPMYKNKKTKGASSDKNARKLWAVRAPEFLTIDMMKRLSTRLQSFAKEGLALAGEMRFQFLPHGTAEGRLSCKGVRKNIDLNLQNIPEDMKAIFKAPNGYSFIRADVSQGENKLTALLAGDTKRLLRLGTDGYDEHAETATFCFGVPVTDDNENKHLRQVGKRINHALNYGCGVKQLQDILQLEGLSVSLSECRYIIDQWRKLNATTYEWQQRVIAEAQQKGYLTNPFGRKRWFQTHDLGPKALAFLPASTLADCVLRMMIGLYPDKFMADITALGIRSVPIHGYLVGQIHDELILCSPENKVEEDAEALRLVMTQPWRELGGYSFDISIKPCGNTLGE